MLTLIKTPEQIVTINTDGKHFKRGSEMSKIGVLENHSIIIEDDLIKDLIPNNSIDKNNYDQVIDAKNKIVLPGLIECHTHTAFAGNRSDEFRMKLQGVRYEDIAKQGGGINATVKAVRESSLEKLVEIISPRIDYFISQGITTLEIKSGYGLSFYDEIKLLQTLKHLNSKYSIDIIPTFLGAHTYPPEYNNDHEKYLEIIIDELIPYITEHNLAVFCDAFCESTAFNAEEVESVFIKAKTAGLKLKLHTDQFNSIGGLDVALNLDAISADHLEVIKESDVVKFENSETTAVLLPGVSFFLDYGYAPARKLIDNNAIVALATDYNPGSSHIANLNLIMSLASLKMGMTIEETISAVTINAAKALDVQEQVGSVEIGKKADLAIINTKHYSDIVYSVGKNLNTTTIKNGEIIYQV